jgi:hypothetical protein
MSMHLSGDVYKDDTTTPTAGAAEVTVGDTTGVDIERAFTDEQVRLFRVRGVVLSFPERMGLNLDVENPVVVVDAGGKTIGTARVLIEDGPGSRGIVADALIQYGCPERLDIEEGLPLYFHPESSVNYLYGTDDEHNATSILIDARLEALKAGADEAATQDIIRARLAKAAETKARVIPYTLVRVTKLLLSADACIDASTPPVFPLPEEG